MGDEQIHTAGAISGRATSQKRHSSHRIAMFDLDPAAIDLSLRTPVGETLLGRHCNELVCPLIQRYVVSDERKQSRADRQPTSKGRRMSQPPSLRDVCAPRANAWSGNPRQKRVFPRYACANT